MQRFARPASVGFVVAFGLTLFAYRSAAFADPGCYWHVRVGERILDDGRFMTTDPFTAPFAGRPWIPQQWGAEVAMAALHRLGGFDDLLVAFAAGVAALWAWLFRRAYAGGMATPLAAGFAALAVAVAGFHFYARPHMATVFGTALVIRAVIAFDRGRPMRGLVWLVPLHAVWTNLHGGMLAGVGTLGLAAAGWMIAFRLGFDSPLKSRRDVVRLCLVVTACGFTMFVNPFGLEMQRTWLRIVGSPAMKQYVTEHMPLGTANPPDLAVIGFAVLAAAVLFTVPRREVRVPWLLAGVWLVLTVQAVRQGPLFVVVAAAVVADAWRFSAWHRRLGTLGDGLTRNPDAAIPPAGWRGLLLPAAAVVAAGIVLRFSPLAAENLAAGPIDLTTPVAAYGSTAPAGSAIFNDVNAGGFLIWHAPHLRIFMDDRFELCGDDWLRYYVESVTRHPERFAEWDSQYRFRAALVASDPRALSPLAEYLANRPAEWRRVADGVTFVFFVRVPEPR